MSKAVELGSDLTDLRNDKLLVGAAAIRLGSKRCALRIDFEAPSCGQRHCAGQDVSQLDHLAGPNETRSFQHGLRIHEVGRAALITCSPFRRTTLAISRWLPRLSLSSRVRQDKCCRDSDDDPSHKLLLSYLLCFFSSYLLCFFSESGSDLVSQRDMTSAI